MSTRDARRAAVVVAVAVAVGLTTAAGAAVAVTAQEQCQPVEDRQVCIQSLSLSDDTLVAGQRGTITATVENVGSAPASAAVILVVVGPDNATNIAQIGQLTLEPGETTEVSQPLDGNTTGTHGLQVQLVDGDTRERYDTTEPVVLDVLAEAPAELGGPLDRTEAALGVLVAALVGMVALGYRQVTE